jgi:hypothetical protein
MLFQTHGRRTTAPLIAVTNANVRRMVIEGRGADNRSARAPREAPGQCALRDANEATERVNATLGAGVPRASLRCECGDPTCGVQLAPTHAEYEAVRAYGSHFIVGLNHENPETSCVLSENAAFAVIDVVVGAARYHARAQNPRHAWTENTTGVPDDG